MAGISPERIQQLLDEGKTPDQIRAMKAQLLAEAGGARENEAGEAAPDKEPDASQDLGPTPATPGPWNPATGIPNQNLGPTPQGEGPLPVPPDLLAARLQAARSKVPFRLGPLGWERDVPAQEGDPAVRELTPDSEDPQAADRAQQATALRRSLPGMALGAGIGGPLAEAIGAGSTARGLLPSAVRVGANAIAGGAASGAGQAVNDMAQGQRPDPRAVIDAAKQGGLLSGGLGLAGEGLAALRNAVARSPGGQARADVEAVGGKVGPLDSGSGGEFDEGGRLAGLKPTDVDIGKASRQSAVNLINRIEGTREAETAPFRASKEALRESGQGQTQIDDLVQYAKGLSTSQRLSPAQRATARAWLTDLQKWGQPTKAGGFKAPFIMPDSELEDFRGMISDQIATDPASVPEAMQGKLAAKTRESVDRTEFGPLNKGISEAASRAEAERRLLRLGDKPSGGDLTPEGLPRTDVERVTNLLARQGQNTVTAGGQNTSVDAVSGPEARSSLDQLAERNPEHALDVAAPRALSAKGDLQFRLRPDTKKGGFIERSKGPAGTIGAGVGAAAIAHMLGIDPVAAAVLAGGGNLARLNLPAIQGRLLYTDPASVARLPGGGGAAMMGAALDPLQALLLRMQQQQGETK